MSEWIIVFLFVFLIGCVGFLIYRQHQIKKQLDDFRFLVDGICNGNYKLIPLAASLAIVGKNLIPSISLGIFATVVSLMAINWEHADLLPWTAGYLFLAKIMEPEMPVNTTTCSITLFITFTIPFIFNLFYYSKMDVHSGS